MSLANHKRLFCLLILGAMAYSCGSQVRGLKGTMGAEPSRTSSDVKSDPIQGKPKTKPTTPPVTAPIEAPPIVPKEAEENETVVVPGNIAGSHLRCPALESTDRVLSLGCTLTDPITSQKVNIAPLLTNTSWTAKNAPASMRMRTETLPLNSTWSELVTLEFASHEELEAYRGSIRIVYSGQAGANTYYFFEGDIGGEPIPVGSRVTLQNLNELDTTFMGSFQTQQKPGLHEFSIGMKTSATSIRDQWVISSKKKIRNPLGYCLHLESRYHSAFYVDCADDRATQVELNSGMLRIVNEPSEDRCLAVKAILEQDKASAPTVKHFLSTATCSSDDVSQNWAYATF